MNIEKIENQPTWDDVRKAIEMAREADSLDGTVDLDVVLDYPNADNSDLRCKHTAEEIIEQLKQSKNK